MGRVDDAPALAALALALALPVALGGSEILAVPAGGGLWRGIVDPPGAARLGLAAALGLAGAWALRRTRASRPLWLLLVAALPLVPLLTGHALSLLVFQGPTLWIVGLAALGVIVADATRGLPLGRASAPLVALLAFLGAALLGRFLPGAAGPQGDEPHYLVMAESLRSDGDLDLRDEHDSRAYRAFYPGRLVPHRSPASPPGRLYSVHAPGLPMAILPGYAVAGFAGAQLTIGALAALAVALVFGLVRAVTGDEWTARVTAAALALAPPFSFYAVSVYPEAAAALATAVFLWTSRSDPSPRRLLAAAAVAAALPWLHPKFLPLAALGLALTVVRTGPRVRRVLALALGSLGLAGLLALFGTLYGSATLSAAYGAGAASDVSLARVPRGLVALALDRQFGLLPLAPVWLLAGPGAILLWRRAPGDAMRAVLLAASTLVVGASFSMWWGGACPPARFVVPALPALALLLAPAVARFPRSACGLVGAALAVTLVAADAPRAIHNRPDGESALLKVLAPSVSLDALLPSFVPEPGPGEVGVHERRATQELLYALATRRVVGVSGPVAPSELSLPLDLPGAPWSLAPREVRSSRRLDLPPGRYRVSARGSAAAGGGLRLGLAGEQGRIGVVEIAAGATLASLEIALPTGASRFAVSAEAEGAAAVLESVRLEPLALEPAAR